jgi:hypothetical protein
MQVSNLQAKVHVTHVGVLTLTLTLTHFTAFTVNTLTTNVAAFNTSYKITKLGKLVVFPPLGAFTINTTAINGCVAELRD